MIDKFTHEWEDSCVVGCSSEHQLAVTERVLYSLRHVFPGEISNDHLWTAFCGKLCSQSFYSLLCISINGSIGDHDAFGLRGVGGPGLVQSQIIAQVFLQDGAVQRTDGLNIQSGCLFQQILHLRAVFSDDSDVITACFTCPVFFHIQGAELTEAVC